MFQQVSKGEQNYLAVRVGQLSEGLTILSQMFGAGSGT